MEDYERFRKIQEDSSEDLTGFKECIRIDQDVSGHIMTHQNASGDLMHWNVSGHIRTHHNVS